MNCNHKEYLYGLCSGYINFKYSQYLILILYQGEMKLNTVTVKWFHRYRIGTSNCYNTVGSTKVFGNPPPPPPQPILLPFDCLTTLSKLIICKFTRLSCFYAACQQYVFLRVSVVASFLIDFSQGACQTLILLLSSQKIQSGDKF